MNKVCRTFLPLLCVLSFLTQCTENPFFGDDKIVPLHRSISGRVALEDGLSPEGVFVWLEGFDISTRTDGDGFFRITLPPPGAQPGGGLSGVFKVYFYLANYRLDFAYVVILDGYVEFDHGDFDEEGELLGTKILPEFLSVVTSVRPDMIREDYSGSLDVHVCMYTDTNTVEVEIPRMMGDLLTAALIAEIDSDDDSLKLIDNSGDTKRFLTVSNEYVCMPLIFDYVPGMLSPGEYEVIPYLFVRQEGIPAGLLNNLGESVEEFGSGYLQYPIRREGGRLSVMGTPW